MKCENESCLKDESNEEELKIVKPNITFFGESMPDEFLTNYTKDFMECDLLLVMGSSLKVGPFNALPSLVNSECPRVIIFAISFLFYLQLNE